MAWLPSLQISSTVLQSMMMVMMEMKNQCLRCQERARGVIGEGEETG